MEQNVGGLDRSVRFVVGGVLLLVAIAGFAEFLALGLAPSIAALVVAVVLLGTAATRTCAVNRALGIDTRES